MAEAEIDADLTAILSRLGPQDTVEALVFPRPGQSTLEADLKRAADSGALRFNALPMAGCIAVRSSKSVLLELAARDDVRRIAANPQFTAPQ